MYLIPGSIENFPPAVFKPRTAVLSGFSKRGARQSARPGGFIKAGTSMTRIYRGIDQNREVQAYAQRLDDFDIRQDERAGHRDQDERGAGDQPSRPGQAGGCAYSLSPLVFGFLHDP